MKNNLFCLYAQEITPLDTRDKKKYLEILLRLKDDKNNIISPNIFLEQAQKCGLMSQIDAWVI